jgi:hypothetical protein
LSKPEPYTGCSTSKEEEEKKEHLKIKIHELETNSKIQNIRDL